MADLTINVNQTPKRKPNTALMAGVGAAVGAGARYILPTEKEMSSLLNKENVDTFVSSASAVARANSRSILKYGAVGAAVAAGISIIAKALHPDKTKQQKEEDINDIQYSKNQAILDSSDYACQVMWWGD